MKVLRSEARALLAEIVGTDRDPLLIALEIAADRSEPTPLRLEAALGCCRFLHPTLSAAAVAHVPQAANAGDVLDRLMDRLSHLGQAQVTQTIDLAPEPAKKPAEAA